MEKQIIFELLMDDLSKYNITINQINTIKEHIYKLNEDVLKKYRINDLLYLILRFFSRRFASKEYIDVKEYLYADMGNIPEHNAIETKPEVSLEDLLNNPDLLRLTINPKSLIKKGYLYLDSKYRFRDGDLTKMKWYVSTYGTAYDPNITVFSTSRITNIVAIKMFPFKFPNTNNSMNNFNRLYVNILEFEAQSNIINNQKYHFEYEILREPTQTYDESTNNRELNRGNDVINAFNTRNACNEIGKSESIFYFNIPLPSLDKLSLEFKTPDRTLLLDKDIYYGSFVLILVGRSPLLHIVINEPLYISSFDELIISGVTTTSTNYLTTFFVKYVNTVIVLAANATITNNITTIRITAPIGTGQEQLVQVNTLNNGQFPIFVNSKRITSRLEIDYL